MINWRRKNENYELSSHFSNIFLLRLMVILSWLITLVFTTPQAIIFRVMKHPTKEFYQCTTYHFFEDLASPVVVDNTTQLLWHGLTPVQWADLYHTLFNCQVFFAPLIAIITSYIKIFIIIRRYIICLWIGVSYSHNPYFFRRNSCFLRVTQSSNDGAMELRKQQNIVKALKMSAVHVILFVISWMPYTVMATWCKEFIQTRFMTKYFRDTIDKKSAGQVPSSVQEILYLTAVLNSCINPFIYGVYYYTENR